MNSGLLLFATVFAGTLYFGEAIKCYDCTYSTTFDSLSTANCNEGAAFSASNSSGNLNILECTGQCSKLRGQLSSAVTIKRSCSTTCISTPLVAGIGNSCCKTDLCNAAWRMAETTTAVTLAPAIALVLVRLIRG